MMGEHLPLDFGAMVSHKSQLTVELDQEEDGRWIGVIASIPGCLVYGATPKEAQDKVIALALRVIAERTEHGEEGRLAIDETIQFCAA